MTDENADAGAAAGASDVLVELVYDNRRTPMYS